MVEASLVALFLKIAPDIARIAKEVGFNITKAKRDDLILLYMIDHHLSTEKMLNSIDDKLKYIRNKVEKL